MPDEESFWTAPGAASIGRRLGLLRANEEAAPVVRTGIDDYLDSIAAADDPQKPLPQLAPATGIGADFLNSFSNPAWGDDTIPLPQRVQSFLSTRAATGQTFEDVQAGLAEQFPDVDAGAVRQDFGLAKARHKQRAEGESDIEYLARRSVPVGSAVGGAAREKRYKIATDRFEAGEATQEDLDVIARFERLGEIDAKAQETFKGALKDSLARIPAFVGEFWGGGKVIGAGSKALMGARAGGVVQAGKLANTAPVAAQGIPRAVAGHVGQAAMKTPLAPSFWLEEGTKEYLHNPDQNAFQAYAPRLAYATAQVAVLGSLGKVAGSVPTVPGRFVARTGIGLSEQQALDVGSTALDRAVKDTTGKTLGLDTGYGTMGSLLRGDDDALKHAAVQAATFAAFSAMHLREDARPRTTPRPRQPIGSPADYLRGKPKGEPAGRPKVEVMERFADAVNEKRTEGLSRIEAGERLGELTSRFETLLEADPATAKAEIDSLRDAKATPAEAKYRDHLAKIVTEVKDAEAKRKTAQAEAIEREMAFEPSKRLSEPTVEAKPENALESPRTADPTPRPGEVPTPPPDRAAGEAVAAPVAEFNPAEGLYRVPDYKSSGEGVSAALKELMYPFAGKWASKGSEQNQSYFGKGKVQIEFDPSKFAEGEAKPGVKESLLGSQTEMYKHPALRSVRFKGEESDAGFQKLRDFVGDFNAERAKLGLDPIRLEVVPERRAGPDPSYTGPERRAAPTPEPIPEPVKRLTPLESLKEEHEAGRHVDLNRVFEAAGLDARERWIVEQRLQGASYGDMAKDPRAAGVSRQRLEQIEKAAMGKLGAEGKSIAEAVHADEAASRSLDLIERGKGIEVGDLAHDPASVARVVKKRNKGDDAKYDDIDKLTDQLLKEAEDGTLTESRIAEIGAEALGVLKGRPTRPAEEAGAKEQLPEASAGEADQAKAPAPGPRPRIGTPTGQPRAPAKPVKTPEEIKAQRVANLKQNREASTLLSLIKKLGGVSRESWESMGMDARSAEESVPGIFRTKANTKATRSIEDLIPDLIRSGDLIVTEGMHTSDALREKLERGAKSAEGIESSAGQRAIEREYESRAKRLSEEEDAGPHEVYYQPADGPPQLVREQASLEHAMNLLAQERRFRFRDSMQADEGRMVTNLDKGDRLFVRKKGDKAEPPRHKLDDLPDPVSEGTFETEGGAMFSGIPIQFAALDALLRKGGDPRKLIRKWLTSAGDLPAEAFSEKIRKDGAVAAYERDVIDTVRDLHAALGGRRGYARLPEAQVRVLNDALAGDQAALKRLPPEVALVVTRMRDQIDALSQRLIHEGAIQGKLEGVVNSNMGMYLHRTYRVFQDPLWATKVDPAIRNQFKAWLQAERAAKGEATDADSLEAVTKLLLSDGTAADNPIAFLAGRKLGAKDLSILTARKDVPLELRKLWGEVEDPIANYTASVHKMSSLLANHVFLTHVRAQGLGRFLFEDANIGEFQKLFPNEQPVRIAAARDKSTKQGRASGPMAPLDGLITTKEIKTAFEDIYSTKEFPTYVKAYLAALGAAKMSKTVLSHVSTIRNFVGNTGFAVANGHWKAWKQFPAMRALVSDSTAGRQYWRRATELGVVGESVHEGEFRAIREDVFGSREAEQGLAPGMISDRMVARLAKSGLESAQKLYRSMDAVWKLYAWEHEKERYTKARPDWTKEQVEEHAAQIVRDTYPTYSLVPAAVKGVRRLPFVGPFVSFPSEVVRTTYKSVRLAIEEMKDPRTRSIGVKRLIGNMVAMALGPTLAATSRLMNNLTADDEEAMRRYMPAWSKNSWVAHTGHDKDGNRTYIDMGYTDPHAYLHSWLLAVMRGEDVKDVALTVARPFIEEELLTRVMLDAARNKTEQGRPVYNPQSSTVQQAKDSAAHIGAAFVPGSVDSANQLRRSLAGEPNPRSGQPYDVPSEALANVGFRTSTVDLKRSLGYKARAFDKQKTEAEVILKDTTGRYGMVSDQDILAAREKMETARRRVYDELRADVLAAEKLGMSRSEVVKVLKDAGVSQDDVRAVTSGKYAEFRPKEPLRGPTPEESRRRTGLVTSGR